MYACVRFCVRLCIRLPSTLRMSEPVSTYMSASLVVYLSVRLSMSGSLVVCMCPSLYLWSLVAYVFLSIYICIFVCMYLSVSASLVLCLSVCLSVCGPLRCMCTVVCASGGLDVVLPPAVTGSRGGGEAPDPRSEIERLLGSWTGAGEFGAGSSTVQVSRHSPAHCHTALKSRYTALPDRGMNKVAVNYLSAGIASVTAYLFHYQIKDLDLVVKLTGVQAMYSASTMFSCHVSTAVRDGLKDNILTDIRRYRTNIRENTTGYIFTTENMATPQNQSFYQNRNVETAPELAKFGVLSNGSRRWQH